MRSLMIRPIREELYHQSRGVRKKSASGSRNEQLPHERFFCRVQGQCSRIRGVVPRPLLFGMMDRQIFTITLVGPHKSRHLLLELARKRMIRWVRESVLVLFVFEQGALEV